MDGEGLGGARGAGLGPELDQAAVQGRDQAQLEAVLRVPDHGDNLAVAGPLDVALTNGHQVISLSHAANLNHGVLNFD